MPQEQRDERPHPVYIRSVNYPREYVARFAFLISRQTSFTRNAGGDERGGFTCKCATQGQNKNRNADVTRQYIL
jgi:hypothetical protein